MGGDLEQVEVRDLLDLDRVAFGHGDPVVVLLHLDHVVEAVLTGKP